MIISSLKKGDEIVESLNSFVKDKKCGFISGIGAISSAVLKVYDLEKKEYTEIKFDQQMEVVSFSAIVAKLPNGQIAIHPHIVVSNKKFETFGGHLQSAVVSATFEFCFFESNESKERYYDDEIGLNIFK